MLGRVIHSWKTTDCSVASLHIRSLLRLWWYWEEHSTASQWSQLELETATLQRNLVAWLEASRSFCRTHRCPRQSKAKSPQGREVPHRQPPPSRSTIGPLSIWEFCSQQHPEDMLSTNSTHRTKAPGTRWPRPKPWWWWRHSLWRSQVHDLQDKGQQRANRMLKPSISTSSAPRTACRMKATDLWLLGHLYGMPACSTCYKMTLPSPRFIKKQPSHQPNNFFSGSSNFKKKHEIQSFKTC